MNKKNAVVFAIVVVMLVVSSAVIFLHWYTQRRQPDILSGDITAEVALQMMTNGSFPNLTVVDVRTPAEYSSVHIQGAINIPYYNTTDFSKRLSPLSGKGDQEIIVYCRLGNRSHNAWLYLNSTGNYHRLYNLFGGIERWIAKNYPVWRAS